MSFNNNNSNNTKLNEDRLSSRNQALSTRARAFLSQAESVRRNQAPSTCLLYTSPSPRDNRVSRMPSSA